MCNKIDVLQQFMHRVGVKEFYVISTLVNKLICLGELILIFHLIQKVLLKSIQITSLPNSIEIIKYESACDAVGSKKVPMNFKNTCHSDHSLG